MLRTLSTACPPALAAALAVLLAGGLAADPVLAVKDGDSIVVESGNSSVDVRIADIDAPEYRQAWGQEARARLADMVAGRDVELELIGGDHYRRIVARVLVDGVDVGAEMVRGGHAWVPRDYGPPEALMRLEDDARQARRGLWAQDDPTPPWLWRKTGKRRTTPKTLSAIPTVDCEAKRLCSQMANCEEALAYLRQCERKRLDADSDGMPCESLCRGYQEFAAAQ